MSSSSTDGDLEGLCAAVVAAHCISKAFSNSSRKSYTYSVSLIAAARERLPSNWLAMGYGCVTGCPSSSPPTVMSPPADGAAAPPLA